MPRSKRTRRTVYVDDILFFAKEKSSVIELLKKLKEEFEFKENLELKSYIGLNIRKVGDNIYFDQTLKIENLQKVFNILAHLTL